MTDQKFAGVHITDCAQHCVLKSLKHFRLKQSWVHATLSMPFKSAATAVTSAAWHANVGVRSTSKSTEEGVEQS